MAVAVIVFALLTVFWACRVETPVTQRQAEERDESIRHVFSASLDYSRGLDMVGKIIVVIGTFPEDGPDLDLRFFVISIARSRV